MVDLLSPNIYKLASAMGLSSLQLHSIVTTNYYILKFDSLVAKNLILQKVNSACYFTQIYTFSYDTRTMIFHQINVHHWLVDNSKAEHCKSVVYIVRTSQGFRFNIINSFLIGEQSKIR